MSLVDNDRTKRLANAVDRAGTTCFTVGVATPLAGYLYGVIAFDTRISGLWLIVTATAPYIFSLRASSPLASPNPCV